MFSLAILSFNGKFNQTRLALALCILRYIVKSQLNYIVASNKSLAGQWEKVTMILQRMKCDALPYWCIQYKSLNIVRQLHYGRYIYHAPWSVGAPWSVSIPLA